jgi:NitT/TauT family transport system substrate-binding protein
MTTRGKIVITLIILGIAGFGVFRWWDKIKPGTSVPGKPGIAQPVPAAPGAPAVDTLSASNSDAIAAGLAETLGEVQKLAPPGTYQPQGDTIQMELSEYAGYAGLIVANGGLEPNENSYFFKKHGFKVRITLSEEESWSAFNGGKFAASATTVDVLAIYGRQFHAIVPAQIGYSRGADGIVVRKDIKRINHLKGKILVTSQFTEAEFFIRYLAQEAGMGVATMPDLKTKPDPDKVNLVFCADAFAAGDLFLKDIKENANVLAGCVTWAPKTTEVAAQSGGKAQILTTSANLLIVADVLVVNKGFAEQQPDKVAGLVSGLIEGNRMVRSNPEPNLAVIGKAFKWDAAKTRAELGRVHLSNLPENLAFFSGTIAAAGSFGGIFQSAVLAYGSELIKEPADSDRFVDLKHLQALQKSGAYAADAVSIAPMRGASGGAIEGNPLLSKDIRFLFSPNSSTMDVNNKDNQHNLESLWQLLQVSPGSTILLRGHVDNAKVEDFRKQGGESFVRQMALQAMELSKNRAGEVKRLVVEKFKVDPKRIETVGRGWEEPSGADNDRNRRVEAQWFMME